MGKLSDLIDSVSKTNTNINACVNTSNDRKNVSDENDINDMINKYSTYSSNELINEFIKLTIEKKRRGELSGGEIDAIRNTIIPYLNSEQVVELDKLLQMVRNV